MHIIGLLDRFLNELPCLAKSILGLNDIFEQLRNEAVWREENSSCNEKRELMYIVRVGG